MVRREDFPQHLWDAMEDWGWFVSWRSSHGGSSTSIISAEGRMRPNRCPACYEFPDPCDACKHVLQPARQVDADLCQFIEGAWAALSPAMPEKKLLRGYFVHHDSPRFLVGRTSIRRDDFWYLLIRAAQQVYQHARMARYRSACMPEKSVPECECHSSSSDSNAGCFDKERAA
ncbi:hypothetical protein [Chromobacterium subtsugae]|uniref:hypothetical protein n=1 Tax=Chromobacterium subtsugae TaxID=251747 RepID=UPI000640EB5B|nr:hypothetical protein [Chromobacterium subtsugae]